MNNLYTLSLRTQQGFAVLPRIALHFSRRRLHIERLSMDNSDELTEFTIVFASDSQSVAKLIQQLRRVVELRDIAFSEGDALARTANPVRAAAYG